MLLIGSRAVKHHFPFYRRPRDYDFIASRHEVDHFLSTRKWKDASSHDKKVRARINFDDRAVMFEFELMEKSQSAQQLFAAPGHTHRKDSELGIVYQVASPETLFLLKKSHICFNIHWKKTVADYLFLKERLDQSKLDGPWQGLFQLRFDETKARVKFKDRNFDVDNSEFFKSSEKMVRRMIPHDNLHFATCFYDRPLFMEVKDDLTKAAMNPKKVDALSHLKKIQLVQEECMALSLERYILPCVRDMRPFNARQAYVDTAGRMIYNYLPMFLKFFAADNFLEILDLPFDYVEKFLDNVEGLDLPNENIQFARETAKSLCRMPDMQSAPSLEFFDR